MTSVAVVIGMATEADFEGAKELQNANQAAQSLGLSGSPPHHNDGSHAAFGGVT